MNTTLNRLTNLASRLLPAIKAEAACSAFFQYRCLCAGCGVPRKRQRRVCSNCDGVIKCDPWVNYGTCSGDTCC